MDLGRLFQRFIQSSSIAASIGVAGAVSAEPTLPQDIPTATPSLSPSEIASTRRSLAKSYIPGAMPPKGIIIKGITPVGKNFVEMRLPEDVSVMILDQQRIPFALNPLLCVAKHAQDTVVVPRGTKVLMNNNALQIVETATDLKRKFGAQQGVIVFSDTIYPPGSESKIRVNHFPGQAPKGMLFAINQSQAQDLSDKDRELKRMIEPDLASERPFSSGKLIRTKV